VSGKGGLVAALLFVAGVAGMEALRTPLAAKAYALKETADVYAFPPPSHLRVMTLGYHAAVTDLLWAKLLVEYGTHWHEHRPFPDVPRYLDAILELEPTYEPLYKFADTFLVYRPPVGTADDARLARKYLERGVKEGRPNDWRVWLEYGQFLAFTGPGFLTDDAEKDAWRLDGADAITRAVELGAEPDRSMTAASIYNRFGRTDAARKTLERELAMTQDDQEREVLLAQLARVNDDAQAQQIQGDLAFLGAAYSRYRFLSPAEFVLSFPDVDAARCAGPDAADRDRRCAPAWAPRLPSGEQQQQQP
jgi:hypothetical protein